jgi:hypothetical protein
MAPANAEPCPAFAVRGTVLYDGLYNGASGLRTPPQGGASWPRGARQAPGECGPRGRGLGQGLGVGSGELSGMWSG